MDKGAKIDEPKFQDGELLKIRDAFLSDAYPNLHK
jgi:hypothetical protein